MSPGGPATAVPTVAVVGPTATGKSDLGVALALALGGEVVGADASQLYRGMDIGTAKLSYAARCGVPHHQLDVLDVTQEASLAAYQVGARTDMAAVAARGHVPVVVGGSGLYVRAVLDRLEIPPTDPEVRRRLEAELAESGIDTLRRRLIAADPVAAQAIDASNARRIVRALEVVELTGRPFSATMPTRDYVWPTLAIGLRAPRPVLDERVVARVQAMWADGLVNEVRALEQLGLRDGRTASRAIGYAQVLRQLHGNLDEASAKAETTNLTRRLVRRQQSWFEPDDRIHWLDATAPDLLESAVVLARQFVLDNG